MAGAANSTSTSGTGGLSAISPSPKVRRRIWAWRSEMRPRYSRDGARLLYLSETPLGEDGPAKLQQAYLYDAPTGQRTCLSCDPHRETTEKASLRGSGGSFGGLSYVAQYRPDTLSADGSRAYFETAEALVDRGHERRRRRLRMASRHDQPDQLRSWVRRRPFPRCQPRRTRRLHRHPRAAGAGRCR